MTRRLLIGLGLFGLALVGYLLAWPVPIDPVAWEAPTLDPNAWSPTGSLASAERVAIGV